MKKIFFYIFSLSFVIVSAQSVNGMTKEMVNNKELPSLTLEDLNGKKINIAEFGKNGKITVFSFWATWCSPCKKELNNISYMYEDWQDDYDIELVAISVDDARNAAKVKSYVNGQGWDFEVLLDNNEDLKRLMNFQTVPYTVLIDKNGKIVYSHSGYVEGDEYILEEKIKALNN